MGQDFIEIFINKDTVVFNYLRNKLVVEISQRCKVLGLVQEINLAHFPVTNIYSTEREKGEGKAISFATGTYDIKETENYISKIVSISELFCLWRINTPEEHSLKH